MKGPTQKEKEFFDKLDKLWSEAPELLKAVVIIFMSGIGGAILYFSVYGFVERFDINLAGKIATSSEKTDTADWRNDSMPVEEFKERIRRAESEEPPRITGNETDEEIRDNPYIRHIRVALNGYLDGSNAGAEEIMAIGTDAKAGCGLSDADSSYYKSKFILYKVSDSDYGGVQAYIIFVDKPDTIFGAWVYRLGGDGEYSLRGFCKVGPSDDLKEEFTETMESIIKRGEFKFSL